MSAIELLIVDLDKCFFDTFSIPIDDDAGALIPDSAKTYGDERHLAKIKINKILITAGRRERQLAKAAKVNAERFFQKIIVVPSAAHKEAAFEAEMRVAGLSPWQIAVLGDNPLSELGAGKRLRMHTVQTLRPTIDRWEEADFHISSFSELEGVLAVMEERNRALALM